MTSYVKHHLVILEQVVEDMADFKSLLKDVDIKDLIPDQYFTQRTVIPMTTMGDGEYPNHGNDIEDEDLEMLLDWLYGLLDHRQGSMSYNGPDQYLLENRRKWRQQLVHWLAIRPVKGKIA